MRQGRGSGRKDPAVDVALEEVVMAPREIDVLADTQSEPSSLPVDAGVSDLKVLFHDGKVSLPVVLSIQTSTGLHRGVHMSRLVHAASSHGVQDIVSWLRRICKEVNGSQPGSVVTCSFELPYSDQFIPVSIKASERGAVQYRFVAKGMTACPCSKRMIGVGHMQRAELVMMAKSRKPLEMLKLVRNMEECFSAVPTEKMKRVEEARKILEAQDHAKFAEDLVRECVRRFPNSLYVRARCFESIHAHDAIATWSRRTGWVPDY